MLVYFILIFFILFYFIMFKTPFWISNLTFEFGKQKFIHLRYIISKDSNYYITPIYRFRHSHYDGKLISNILKKKKFIIHKLKKINNYELYKNNNIVNNLLNITNDMYDKKFTKFANVCSNIMKFVSSNSPSSINVAIVVNNRNNTNFNSGNYISFGFLTIHKRMDIKTIMIKYNKIVNYARNKETKNFSLYDLYLLLNCDLILNSWRDLSIINNSHNLLLKRLEGNILDKEYILNFLISKKKKKLVYFDYFGDNYVINKLEYLNV
jgi:hypothetical protein